MRRAVAVLAAVSFAATVAACTVRVPPPDTDPAITQFVDDHVVVWNPYVERRGVLYVHLPGTGGVPANSELVLREAALQGVPAIGLTYPNRRTVNSLCDGRTTACPGAVRNEIVNGVDSSPLVSVNVANSVVNRLTKLLQHLSRLQPGFGWDTYLDGAEPRWERIVVGGHSQGAGHAAFIATQHRVARVAMYAGAHDTVDGRFADWLQPGATPGERFFGFVHREDGAIVKQLGWQRLGATGALTPVDGATPPYGGNHMLVTDVPSANPHGSVVVDARTPKRADGTPLFAPVWRHLCCDGLA
jgi:hypothetical protein